MFFQQLLPLHFVGHRDVLALVRLQQEQQAQQAALSHLRHSITTELDNGGWRLGPVAKRLHQILETTGWGDETGLTHASPQGSQASQPMVPL